MFVGLTGRVGTISEARDELGATTQLVRLLGAVTSSDLGTDVWGDGAAFLAQFCVAQLDRIDAVLGDPEEGRRP